jgi:hypothetical protein
MTFSSLLRAFQHEFRVLLLDVKLLGTLTLIPCFFLLILTAKGPATPTGYIFLVPLPPELPSGADDNLRKLFTYLAAGGGASQEMMAYGVPSAIRDILLSKNPADEELLEAERAITEYLRTVTAEKREALRQVVEPAEAKPAATAPVKQPPPAADATPSQEIPAPQPPPLSGRAIVRRLVMMIRNENEWLIDARSKFPDALQAMLKREDALAFPLNPTQLAAFRDLLQRYYLGPATESFANASEAISGLLEAWDRYTTLADLLFSASRQRDDFEEPSRQLAKMYKFISKIMGDGDVHGFDRRSRLSDALASLVKSGTAFYWDGIWEAFVRDSTSGQDIQAQQSRATTLAVLNLYSSVGPGRLLATDQQKQITPDLLYIVLDSISNFGEVHGGYDSTVDEHWRAMMILGLFPPVMAFFLASGQIQRDRRYGVLPLVVVATGNRIAVLIATRTVAVLCISTFIFVIITSFSFLLNGLPSQLPSLTQTAGLIVCLFSGTLAGLALSFWVRSERQTYFITAVLILASVLFGGVIESLANAAPLSRLIGCSLPTAAFIAVLREWASASLYPMNWLQVAAICWPPACLGVIAICISAVSWRRHL